jgi:S-adenosylmethionine:tRNA ribosyltransferase-isomerase
MNPVKNFDSPLEKNGISNGVKLSDFDYHLPKELIAQHPLPERDKSKLLVLDRNKKEVQHKRFIDLVEYLNQGDTLVLNDTKVIPAKLIGQRKTGGKVELLLLEQLNENTFRALLNSRRKLKIGEEVSFDNKSIRGKILDRGIVQFNTSGILDKIGLPPLPPYIKRQPNQLDRERYQTIYAKEEGSIAAPTAGLHFTQELLKLISDKSVKVVYLTLHVGLATFEPVRVEDITQHKMEPEYFQLPKRTASILNQTKGEGKRVFAVGTTTARVLETKTRFENGEWWVEDGSGWANLFIYPPYQFRFVDCLLTNFHLPRTSLIMLVSAFCDRDFLIQAYQEAIKERYRFYSYGDAMLIIGRDSVSDTEDV